MCYGKIKRGGLCLIPGPSDDFDEEVPYSCEACELRLDIRASDEAKRTAANKVQNLEHF